MLRSYVKAVWARAMSETWRDATGSNWTNRIVQVLLVLGPLGSAFAWQRLRPDALSQSAFQNAEFTFLSALAGLGTIMVLFFAWHLVFAAPYQLWREQKERTASAERALAESALEDPPSDWIALPEALKFAAYGTWEPVLEDNAAAAADNLVRMHSAANRFQQLHSDGYLQIRGTPDRHVYVHMDLPRDIWREQQIERLSIFERKAKTEYIGGGVRNHPIHYRLVARTSEIEKIFGSEE